MQKVEKLAIVGAGTMGTGIAINAAANGIPVHVIDLDPNAVERTAHLASAFFERQLQKGRMTSQSAEIAKGRISGSGDYKDVSTADLIIEAVFEDKDIKRQVFQNLHPFLKRDAIVATNTSALRLSDLSDVFPSQDRFVGLHYFSPAEINPLVELVSGPHSSPSTVSRVEAYLHATAKTPLKCRDQYGFTVNRFFCPFTNEAARLLDENLGTTGRIDQIAESVFDLPMGPFAVMNIVKPRINLQAIRNLSPLGKFYVPADSMVRVGSTEQPWDVEDSQMDSANDHIIGARLCAAVFFAVLQLIDEQIAHPDAVDLGAVLGLRFGSPPCAMMDQLGETKVRQLIEPICQSYGYAMPQSVAMVGKLILKTTDKQKETAH